MQRIIPSLISVALLTVAAGAWAGSGVVALQSADPSCGDDSGDIYVDCGNGTVTDNRTGLVWLADASCFNNATWNEAMEIVAGLADIPPGSAFAGLDCGLADGSLPGEWRLPTGAELETMMADALGAGVDPDCTVTPPTITNDSGQGCWISGPSSFSNVQNASYWSATPVYNHAGYANLQSGVVGDSAKTVALYIWPVRGGQ